MRRRFLVKVPARPLFVDAAAPVRTHLAPQPQHIVIAPLIECVTTVD